MKLLKAILFEKGRPRKYTKYFLYILAKLRFRWIFWRLNEENNLRYYPICKKQYKLVSKYHKYILKEKDPKKRGKIYNNLYHDLYIFLKKYCKLKIDFGFNPRLINEQSKLFENKIVVDYGCGYGLYTESLSKIVKFAYGIDASGICIKTARKKFKDVKNIKFMKQSNSLLPFEEEVIDVVFSQDLLEHFHPDDMITHLKDVHRVLKKGGSYLFWTPGSPTGPHDITKHYYPQGMGFKPKGGHIKEYTFAEFITILKKIGYTKIELPDLKKEVLIIATK